MIPMEDILSPDDSDIGYFIEVDLNYSDNIKEKTKFLLITHKISQFMIGLIRRIFSFIIDCCIFMLDAK